MRYCIINNSSTWNSLILFFKCVIWDLISRRIKHVLSLKNIFQCLLKSHCLFNTCVCKKMGEMEKYIDDDYDYYRPNSSSSNTLPMPKNSVRQRFINSVKSPFSSRRTKSSTEIQSNDSKFKLFFDISNRNYSYLEFRILHNIWCLKSLTINGF